MLKKSMLRHGFAAAIFAVSGFVVAGPAEAAPPQGKGNTQTAQANKPDTPPGNKDCTKDEGKASPKKANPKGNACGQTGNPPFN